GYAACVDPAPDGHGGTACAYAGPSAILPNGIKTVTVDTGAHTVQLMGVAANCTVAGDNPRAVHVARGELVDVPFAIACAQPTLHIITTTTGVSIPDGYDLCIDPNYYYSCTYESGIGANAAVTVPVTPGTHFVELRGVA